jgi:hypothetical protein
MASLLQWGMTMPAPLPSAGQMAPKIQAEARRWSLGAQGRVPRLAHRRVSLVGWPIRASSCHHSSTGVPVGRAFLIFARRAANVF